MLYNLAKPEKNLVNKHDFKGEMIYVCSIYVAIQYIMCCITHIICNFYFSDFIMLTALPSKSVRKTGASMSLSEPGAILTAHLIPL